MWVSLLLFLSFQISLLLFWHSLPRENLISPVLLREGVFLVRERTEENVKVKCRQKRKRREKEKEGEESEKEERAPFQERGEH